MQSALPAMEFRYEWAWLEIHMLRGLYQTLSIVYLYAIYIYSMTDVSVGQHFIQYEAYS